MIRTLKCFFGFHHWWWHSITLRTCGHCLTRQTRYFDIDYDCWRWIESYDQN
jgi:hypothetical protein